MGVAVAGAGERSVSFKFGVFSDEIRVCFKGATETDTGGSKLPVELAITNSYSRPVSKTKGKTKHRYVFNLDQSRTFRADSFKVEVGETDYPCAIVYIVSPFSGARNATQVGTLTIRASSENVHLGQAKYSYAIRVLGKRTIWEGTDAFVNYCLNEGATLWSSGGKLYCTAEPVVLSINAKRIFK